MVEEETETLYAIAFGLYEKGDYERSSQFFTQLLLSNPWEMRFWKGLASARQMAAEYEKAARAWAVICLLGEEKGEAHFHAAECLFSLGEKEEALKALSLAKEKCSSPLLEAQIINLRQRAYG